MIVLNYIRRIIQHTKRGIKVAKIKGLLFIYKGKVDMKKSEVRGYNNVQECEQIHHDFAHKNHIM